MKKVILLAVATVILASCTNNSTESTTNDSTSVDSTVVDTTSTTTQVDSLEKVETVDNTETKML
jgi:uncharacterized protein YcfL